METPFLDLEGARIECGCAYLLESPWFKVCSFCVMFILSEIFYWYTETRLASARRTKGEDISEDDIPCTSGRQFMEAADGEHSDVPKVDGI